MSAIGGGLHDDNMEPERKYLKSEPTWHKQARETLFIALLGLAALAAARIMPLPLVLLLSHLTMFALGGFMGFKTRDSEHFDNRRPRR